MTFIWSCMVLAFKATLGGIFWGIGFCIIGLGLALVFSLFDENSTKKEKKK